MLFGKLNFHLKLSDNDFKKCFQLTKYYIKKSISYTLENNFKALNRQSCFVEELIGQK